MSTSSADLFSYAASGSQTEASMGIYSKAIAQYGNDTQGMSGWLSSQVQDMQGSFKKFMDSKLWEYGARILGGGDGDYVGRYQIGYLGTLQGLQGATGFMRDYIMANPNIGRLYADELIEGYNGDFSPDNTGIGKDNYYYRRATNGVVLKEMIDEKQHWSHSHHFDTGTNELSFRDRVNIHSTWLAADTWMANELLDITSPMGHERITPETNSK